MTHRGGLSLRIIIWRIGGGGQVSFCPGGSKIILAAPVSGLNLNILTFSFIRKKTFGTMSTIHLYYIHFVLQLYNVVLIFCIFTIYRRTSNSQQIPPTKIPNVQQIPPTPNIGCCFFFKDSIELFILHSRQY